VEWSALNGFLNAEMNKLFVASNNNTHNTPRHILETKIMAR
jgi:hypothetical protein